MKWWPGRPARDLQRRYGKVTHAKWDVYGGKGWYPACHRHHPRRFFKLKLCVLFASVKNVTCLMCLRLLETDKQLEISCKKMKETR